MIMAIFTGKEFTKEMCENPGKRSDERLNRLIVG